MPLLWSYGLKEQMNWYDNKSQVGLAGKLKAARGFWRIFLATAVVIVFQQQENEQPATSKRLPEPTWPDRCAGFDLFCVVTGWQIISNGKEFGFT